MNRELHIVGFQVGRETYGVPITSLHEIVRVPEITAVPDAPDYLEGVINLRGKIVSVMDLRKRFGDKQRHAEKAEPDSGGGAFRQAGGIDRGLGDRSTEDCRGRRRGSAIRIPGRRTELCHGIGQGSRAPDRIARHDQIAGSGQPADGSRECGRQDCQSGCAGSFGALGCGGVDE